MAERFRNFRAVVWDESANSDWIAKLEERLIPHYRIHHTEDKNDDGSPEKPHWHLVIKFDSVKTVDQVTRILKDCCGDGCNTALPADSLSGAVRYLTHTGWDDKYQYDHKDVVAFGGCDYVSDLTANSDINVYRSEIQRWIEDNNIISYMDLSWWATNITIEWSRCVNGQTLYWVKYLISREDKLKTHVHSIVDDVRSNYYAD